MALIGSEVIGVGEGLCMDGWMEGEKVTSTRECKSLQATLPRTFHRSYPCLDISD